MYSQFTMPLRSQQDAEAGTVKNKTPYSQYPPNASCHFQDLLQLLCYPGNTIKISNEGVTKLKLNILFTKLKISSTYLLAFFNS